MEPKTTDENKAHDVENKNTSSPIERLHSRESSSSSSSIQSSEFEDPSQGEISSKAFSRNKSGNPGEWSMHSNESLFSIKMGTTSFTDHEQRNGDSYKNVDEHNRDRVSSVKPADLPAQPSINEKPADVMDSKQNKSAVSTNQESKKEVVDRKSNTKSSPNYEEIRQSARNSNASGQSFAFPLLVKDQDGASPQGKPQTPKRITSSNINQIQVENRPATQSSSSWFTRCFSFCSCRQS